MTCKQCVDGWIDIPLDDVTKKMATKVNKDIWKQEVYAHLTEDEKKHLRDLVDAGTFHTEYYYPWLRSRFPRQLMMKDARKECECLLDRMRIQRYGSHVMSAPYLDDPSPLIGKIQSNIIFEYNPLTWNSHFKDVVYNQGKDLIHYAMATMPQLMASATTKDEKSLTLIEYAENPDLLIVDISNTYIKSSEFAQATLINVLHIRRSLGKPTWILNDIASPWGPRHTMYSTSLDALVDTFTLIQDGKSNNQQGKSNPPQPKGFTGTYK